MITFILMKALLPAYDGLKTLPKALQWPVRVQCWTYMITPIMASAMYDIDNNAGWGWGFGFSIIVIIYLSFVLNILKVHPNPYRAWWNVLSLPVMTFITAFILGWDVKQGFINLYIFEITGFMIGLLIGTLFRGFVTSAGQIAGMFALVGIFVLVIVLRFQMVFVEFASITNWTPYITIAIPIFAASIPSVQLFGSQRRVDEMNKSSNELMMSYMPLTALMMLVLIFMPTIIAVAQGEG